MVAPIRLDVAAKCLFVITLYQIETSRSHIVLFYINELVCYADLVTAGLTLLGPCYF